MSTSLPKTSRDASRSSPITVRAFFCSCQPLYRVPSYSIKTLKVVMCYITAEFYANINGSRTYHFQARKSEHRSAVRANHLLKRFSPILLRADGGQNDVALPRRCGVRLDHLFAVFSADAADGIRIRARAGALREHPHASRDSRRLDARHPSFPADPLRFAAG